MAEATADNLFLIRKLDGWEDDPSRVTVTTPDPAFCLVGITRLLIMDQARKLGYTVTESSRMLPIDLIGDDTECFMTGTGCGLMPVVGLEEKKIGNGKPGAVTNRLLEGIRGLMADDDYGLSIDADEKQFLEYMKRPVFSKR